MSTLREVVIEECAKLCSTSSVTLRNRDMSRGALICADEIRAAAKELK